MFLTFSKTDFIEEFAFYNCHDLQKIFVSWQVTHSRFLYSQFECSGNTFLAINSELLADAVWQTWPSAMGRRAIFLQKFLKGENLKFMLVIWESILRDQTEFKTFFQFLRC